MDEQSSSGIIPVYFLCSLPKYSAAGLFEIVRGRFLFDNALLGERDDLSTIIEQLVIETIVERNESSLRFRPFIVSLGQ